jgi:hypothetical protein
MEGWRNNPHPATDLLLLDGDGFGRIELNWENIEIEENLIKLKKWRDGETIPIPPFK